MQLVKHHPFGILFLFWFSFLPQLRRYATDLLPLEHSE